MLNTQNLIRFANRAKNLISSHSPTILTGLGVAGVVSTTAMAIKATPKAMLIMEEVNNEAEYVNHKDPKFMDYVSGGVWKPYIPTIIMGAATIGCIIGANSINLKRHAALASLYSASELAIKEYQNKVAETIGKNKEEKIRDELAGDILAKNPVDEAQIIFTGEGDTLCYEVMSGRYFKHDINKIKQIMATFNQQLIYNDSLCLNDLYELMHLDGIRLGEMVGWNTTKLLEFDFRSKLASNGTPCLVIDYLNEPTPFYRDW